MADLLLDVGGGDVGAGGGAAGAGGAAGGAGGGVGGGEGGASPPSIEDSHYNLKELHTYALIIIIIICLSALSHLYVT